MRYYIIAGEASGDLHASHLIKSLRHFDDNMNLRGWGGDLMQSAGTDLVRHYRDLAFMGFVEVLQNIRTIYRNIQFCKKDITAFRPDVLILVDYPGFNLRIARWAKQQGIRVCYYISPQIWAWHSSRVHRIKKDIDRMLVILPFEKTFYENYDFHVDYVGHPLLDVVESFHHNNPPKAVIVPAGKKMVALLPGSRRQEITRTLEIMLELVPRYPNCQFVVAGAPSIPKEVYQKIFDHKRIKNVEIVFNQTYALLNQADAALVTSGTATLETALFEVPQVVCYKGGKVSYLIAKRVINVKYISLVNLILDQPLVKELIQDDFNVENLHSELEMILSDIGKERLKSGYLALKSVLGMSGASNKAAGLIWDYFGPKSLIQ